MALENIENSYMNISSKLDMFGIEYTKIGEDIIIYKDYKNETTVINVSGNIKEFGSQIPTSKLMGKVRLEGKADLRSISFDKQEYMEEVTIDLPNTHLNNMNNMFRGCENLRTINIINLDTSNVQSMWQTFENCKELQNLNTDKIDTSSCRGFRQTFAWCIKLEELDLSSWNTSNALDMSEMFYGCKNLRLINTQGWDTKNVYSFKRAFRMCSNLLEIDTNSFNTSSLANVEEMFRSCTSLKIIDISKWDTSKIYNANSMFQRCTGLTAIIGLNNMLIDSLVSASYMFEGCESLKEINLSKWKLDEHRPLNISCIFYGCKSVEVIDLRNLSFAKALYIIKPFGECINLKTLHIYDINLIDNADSNIFYNCKHILNIYIYNQNLDDNSICNCIEYIECEIKNNNYCATTYNSEKISIYLGNKIIKEIQLKDLIKSVLWCKWQGKDEGRVYCKANKAAGKVFYCSFDCKESARKICNNFISNN